MTELVHGIGYTELPTSPGGYSIPGVGYISVEAPPAPLAFASTSNCIIGKLGSSDLPASAYTVVYTAPSNVFAPVSLHIYNRDKAAVPTIRVAVSLSGTPTNDEFIEYNVPILTSAYRAGMVIGPDESLVVYSDTANVSAVVTGVEQII